MASNLTELLYHCIWSTKGREKLIFPAIEKDVWSIIAATATRNEMHVIRAGGVEDHVHVLSHIPKTMSVSDAMKRLKGGASKYINEQGLLDGGQKFGWQDGYGAFTVSKSNVPAVVKYIATQREHHRTQTFKEEFVAFLKRHEIDYDPEHLWG